MTSAIETINPKELKMPTGNLTAALAGRLAGVISYQKVENQVKIMLNSLYVV